ncbi:putative N-acetyltransferase YafP [Planctomycetes bacterium Poly30]|uniref:Putative N-acetyltransferase YafP n=1 Tax=Saltatorellus ferox TaxID=2528018 RepID=A0A518ETH9_9BACT|nr:putative N-acetyltransferase YafP [Planctomycetes bacterium Poly30]
MEYRVRHSITDAEDVSMLSRLMHESVHGVADSAYSAEERAAWSPAPRDGEEARERFAGQHVWIAEDDEGPCAFMTLKDDGYLDFAYALPRAAGRGAAGRVYDALEAWARAEGVGTLTSDISLVARPFMEKRGWHVLRKQENVVGEVILINFRMEKNLSAEV